MNSLHIGPVTRKMFPFDNVNMNTRLQECNGTHMLFSSQWTHFTKKYELIVENVWLKMCIKFHSKGSPCVSSFYDIWTLTHWSLPCYFAITAGNQISSEMFFRIQGKYVPSLAMVSSFHNLSDLNVVLIHLTFTCATSWWFSDIFIIVVTKLLLHHDGPNWNSHPNSKLVSLLQQTTENHNHRSKCFRIFTEVCLNR